MDILSIVHNHLVEQTIQLSSLEKVVLHTFPEKEPIEKKLTYLSFILEYDEIQVQDYMIEPILAHCDYVRDSLEFAENNSLMLTLPSLCSEEGIELLCDFLHTCGNDPTPPMKMYTMRPQDYMSKNAASFFRSLLSKEEGIQKLLRCIDTINYLACKPFMIYAFSFLYVLSITSSCEERERLFGHKFFMLPIEGWNSPLLSIHPLPLLKVPTEYIDGKYRELLPYRMILLAAGK